MIFAVYAATTLLSLVWLLVGVHEEGKKTVQTSTFATVCSLFKDRYIGMLFLGILFIVGIDVGLNTTVPKLLIEKTGMSVSEAGLGSSLYFSARTIGAFIGSFLLARIASDRFMQCCMGIAVIGFVLLLMADSLLWISILVVIVGLACSNVFSIIFSYALQHLPERDNEISALMIMGVSGGALITPLMGVLSDALGQVAGLSLLLLCLLYLGWISFRLQKGKECLILILRTMNIKYFLKVAVCLLAWVTAVPASSESIRTRAVPALYRTAGGLKQEVQVIIEHQGVSTQATVNFNGQVKNIRLSEGENICSFELDEIKNEQQIPLSVSYAGDTHQSAVTVKPVRHWQVNMVQHTHTDIGYTRSQMEILAEHLRYIDYALDYCDATDQYPDDAKFRWTCEIAWAVSEYLKCRPAEQVARLKKRVKEGRIELATMYLNFDELPDEQTLAASLYPLKQFREAGLRAEVAMQMM